MVEAHEALIFTSEIAEYTIEQKFSILANHVQSLGYILDVTQNVIEKKVQDCRMSAEAQKIIIN